MNLGNHVAGTLYRVTVTTDKVVGRFYVAAEDIIQAKDIGRAWAEARDYKPTEIAVKSKKEDGVAVSVFIPV
jgi:hypothetical protein